MPDTLTPSPVYPLRLEGELEPRLRRWLWLVKWLLAIPHVIVLIFLWIALSVFKTSNGGRMRPDLDVVCSFAECLRRGRPSS